MQSNSKRVNPGESNLFNVSKSRVHSEPWGNDTGYKPFPPEMMQGNASDSSSLEQSVDGQLLSEDGMNDEDAAAAKQISSTLPLHPDRNHGVVDRNQYVSTVQPRIEGLMQPPQLELVGHSIACASNPCDPYYGGIMATYGQPCVHVPPRLFDMHPARMLLPLEMEQEPVYVNAKQYNGILRRRQMRAKAELEKKLIKVRKPYLHESRHQHALRRARGSGGRFTKKSDAATSKGGDSGSTFSAQSISSSGSKALPVKSSEANAPKTQNARNNDVFNFRNQSNVPAYQSTGEGLASGQQWGNIPSNHAFAMK